MKAKSIKGKTAGEIKTSLENAMLDGFLPTLAVVFISTEKELNKIQRTFSEKHISIFGSSSGSEFVDGEVKTGTIVALLLDIDRTKFSLQFLDSDSSVKTALAEQIGKIGLSTYSKLAFVIVSGGMKTDGDEIVMGIENACGKGTTIFGGLACNDFTTERTFVFTNDAISDNGLVALIFDEEKVSINGIAVGGWRPMGMDRVITRSEGNIVYTIDNEPALDFILRYSGLKVVEAIKEDFLFLGSNFQVQLQRENMHPIMRTPMQWNKEDHSVVFAGKLPQGSKVRLCLLPGFEVIDEALNEFTLYKNTQQEADAMIMFSCGGRQLSLGPYVANEIDGVKKIWDVPMAGFFCYGEIGRVKNGSHEFHNMTCSLTLIKEK